MGLSITHIIILLVIVLLIFGPKNLPKLGQSIGEAIKGFKKGLSDNEIDVTNTRDRIKEADTTHSTSHKVEEKEKDKV